MQPRARTSRGIPTLICGVGALATLGTASTAARADEQPSPTPSPTLTQVAAPGSHRGAAVSLQGGWWSVEAEWRARFGLYAAAGIPWVAIPLTVLNGATWVVPLGARLGYDLPLSPRWSVRASGQVATMLANERSKCGCDSDEATWRTFLFAAVGIRYQDRSGFVAGADLPVFGLRTPHHPFPPPVSLAFTQAYVGHSWGR